MGTGYDIFLTAHLICVVGGFGFLGYTGLVLAVGRRRGAAVGTLEVNLQVGGLAELLVYGAFLFGIAAVGSSRLWHFGQAWVVLALVLFVVDVGVLHGVIKPAQRRYASLAAQLAGAATSAGPPPGVGDIEGLEKRIGAGWGAFNVIAIVVVVLMVVRPGA